jgi:NDP-sugar pyrophosphorylase family protein
MTAAAGGASLVVLAAGRAKRYGGGLKPLAPVGPDGETILDLLGSDALAAGFSGITIVINPDTGDTIRDHVRANWPGSVDVRFALQREARGTVDAALCGLLEMNGAANFAVANADDLYGTPALALLAEHLHGPDAGDALVAFRLDQAVVGDSPVTRGVVKTGPDNRLAELDERRGVARRSDGTFSTGDDRSPAVLDPATLVSMNLFAFSSSIVEEFSEAMDTAGDREVLLPELVGELIARPERPRSFAVLPTACRVVGVTHPDDLPLVQADVRNQIERGERPARAWAAS